MKIPRALRPFAAIALSLGVGHAQQQPEQSPLPRTRVYDVRDITYVEPDFLPATAVEASFVPSANEMSDDLRPALDPADLSTLVQLGTPHTYWEADGTEIRVEDGGLLTVTCSEEMHAKVRRVLAQLRQLLFGPLLVEVHELPGSTIDGQRSVLSADEADALLSKAGEHRVLAGRANAHKPLLLESKRIRNRIAGLHMRVAQDAVAPDLALATDTYGASWTVRATRSADDSLVVAVSGSDRSLEPDGTVCELPTGADGKFAAVQLPVTRIATCHTSAYLRPGQALLVGSDAPSGTVLCVRVLRSGPAAGGELGELTVYPVGNLVRGPARAVDLPVPYEDGCLFPAANDEVPPAVFDEGRLMEWLKSQVEPETWEGSPNSMAFLDGQLFVHAETATQQAIAAQLQSLQGLDARQFTLEVRFGEVPADAATTFRAANAEALAGALPHRCLSTVSASRETRMSATRHTPYVKDYDVVIAASSAATTPELGSIAQGFLLRARVAPMDRGALLLDLHLTMLAHDPERTVFPLQDPRFAQVDRVDVRENKVRGATVVALDEWTILHLAPVEGGRTHVAVVARLRST